MAFRIRRKRNINAMKVGIKVGTTVLGLYAGGYFLSTLGTVMNGTASPFYKGVTLIGWTTGDNAFGTYDSCFTNSSNSGGISNCITATSGTGILAIIGVIAIAFLIFEFIDFRM